jgi:cellulose synthase/poly-beta-1,6-N-acetylglucosamine synthase-like glycosyltransferase
LTNSPKVSFLVVTHNDELTLEKCLKSIIKQDYPLFELIVVDASSVDSSIRIANRYADKIILLKSNVLGKSRQISVDNSEGELLAIMDADTVLPPNWTIEAVSKFAQGVGIAWSFNEPPANSSIIARAFFNYWKEVLSDRIKNGRGPIAGSNSMYLKKAVVEVGGFDVRSHYSEDIDLGARVQDRGYTIAILDEPIFHDTMRTLKKYTKNQLWAAKDFSKQGLNRSRLSLRDIAYEHLFLGTRGFIKGIFKKREFSWVVFPLLLSIRILAYTTIFFKNRVMGV